MQRRLKDFDEALNLEAEVARLTKQEYEEQCQKELARHEAIAAENQHAKYMKHFHMCEDVSVFKNVEVFICCHEGFNLWELHFLFS